MDDPFYQKRYNMQIWAGAGAEWPAKSLPNPQLCLNSELLTLHPKPETLTLNPKLSILNLKS
jgi:hypothetical protein